MNIKIVSDSSCNKFFAEGVDFITVPMKVVAQKEYIDSPQLDLEAMVNDLKAFKGKSGSSCPNVQEWVDAFGGADYVIGLTITKYLSGSYNAAQQAAQTYMEENPGKRVYILDSLTAGPEMMMLVDKLKEIMAQETDFDAVLEKIRDYSNHCHTLFCLESLTNLARNGRINPAVAKIAGVLGIRVCGDVQGGQITPIHKPRGARKATQTLLELVKERGFQDGNLLRIAHCFGREPAQALIDAVRGEFPNARFILEPTTALCSFYAEAGGLMIGMEGRFNEANDNNKF